MTISIRAAKPLYQTAPLLIAGYAILFLPRAVVTARAALAQAPPHLVRRAHQLVRATKRPARGDLAAELAALFAAVPPPLPPVG